MANQVGVRLTRGTVGPIAIGPDPGDKLFCAVLAERGPANKLVLCSSFAQFTGLFGGATPRTARTSFSAGYETISDWFTLGGGSVVVLRIVGEATKATIDLLDRKAVDPIKVFTVNSKGPGTAYNAVNAVISAGTRALTFKLTVTNDAGVTLERFDNLLSNGESAQLVSAQSLWVDLVYDATNDTASPDDLPALGTFSLAGGTDDNDPTAAEIVGTVTGSVRTGLKTLRTNLYRRGILLAPDLDSDALVVAEMKALGLPFNRVTFTSAQEGATLATAATQRGAWDDPGVAFYFPRKEMLDAYDKGLKTVPLVGQVAAHWMREIAQKGQGKPPAGPGFLITGRIERTAQGDPLIEQEDADQLVAQGVNPIWDRDGLGSKVWGAVAATSEPAWRSISAAYIYCVIGDALYTTLNQQVFEVFTPDKFDELYMGVYRFLSDMHRDGAFFGLLPSPMSVPNAENDAFAVLTGTSILSPQDIANKIIRVKVWFKEALSGETIEVEIAKQTA